MAEVIPAASPQESDLESWLAIVQEAAENEYKPSFRALQNDSTVVQIARSAVGTPGPDQGPVTRVKSPEPQDFTTRWPEPDSNL